MAPANRAKTVSPGRYGAAIHTSCSVCPKCFPNGATSNFTSVYRRILYQRTHRNYNRQLHVPAWKSPWISIPLARDQRGTSRRIASSVFMQPRVSKTTKTIFARKPTWLVERRGALISLHGILLLCRDIVHVHVSSPRDDNMRNVAENFRRDKFGLYGLNERRSKAIQQLLT